MLLEQWSGFVFFGPLLSKALWSRSGRLLDYVCIVHSTLHALYTVKRSTYELFTYELFTVERSGCGLHR